MSQPKFLTSHLLSLKTPTELYTRATQSPFLHHAATNKLPKPLLSQWLANDLLYMRGYIKLAGELLRIIKLPSAPASSSHDNDGIEHRLVDWLVNALVNIRREERFFADVGRKYGIDLSLVEGEKIEGLKMYEGLVDRLTKGRSGTEEEGKEGDVVLPWLEGVVLFWATEHVYFTAWSWAKTKASESTIESGDGMEDVMREEFIPNWTNDEFKAFVVNLEGILNAGVEGASRGDERRWREIVDRAERVWVQVLDAEAAFWPEV